MIDAAWFPAAGWSILGDSGSSDYTTLAYVEGVGKGATITPAKGDTTKHLLILNAGWRDTYGGSKYPGRDGTLWSTTQRDTSSAYRIHFYSTDASDNNIKSVDKLDAYSLRCVRS